MILFDWCNATCDQTKRYKNEAPTHHNFFRKRTQFPLLRTPLQYNQLNERKKMPVSINSIAFKEISFKTQDDLKDDGMHFVNVHQGQADLQFVIEAQVVNGPTFNEKFGYYEISVQPEMKDHTTMYQLQEMFNPQTTDFRRHLRTLGMTETEFNRCYKGEVKDIFYKGLLYLKLKPITGQDKFQFFCNKPEFTPSNLGVMQPYDSIRITVRPGLFFNSETAKAGWFFSVKAILFPETVQEVKKVGGGGRKKN